VDEGKARGERVSLDAEEYRVTSQAHRCARAGTEPEQQVAGGEGNQRREQDPFARS